MRLKRNIEAGDTIKGTDLESLRPAPNGSIPPYAIKDVIGKTLKNAKNAGDALYHTDLEE